MKTNLVKKLERRAGREIIIDEGFVWLWNEFGGWFPWIEVKHLTAARIDGLKSNRLYN